MERGRRQRMGDGRDTQPTVGAAESSVPGGRKQQCQHSGGNTETVRTVNERTKVTTNKHTRQKVDALSEEARWRRRTVEGCATEYIDFWENADKGWATRFHIRKDGAVAGRGLFAARDYAKGEYMTVYMGRDMGGVNTPVEGIAAQEKLAAIRRADHVMGIAGRLVDGRKGISGAQYINTAKGMKGRTDNARFSATTGSIVVTANGGIKAGTEILMSYGQAYWQQRAKDARADIRYGRRDARRGGWWRIRCMRDGE